MVYLPPDPPRWRRPIPWLAVTGLELLVLVAGGLLVCVLAYAVAFVG